MKGWFKKCSSTTYFYEISSFQPLHATQNFSQSHICEPYSQQSHSSKRSSIDLVLLVMTGRPRGSLLSMINIVVLSGPEGLVRGVWTSDTRLALTTKLSCSRRTLQIGLIPSNIPVPLQEKYRAISRSQLFPAGEVCRSATRRLDVRQISRPERGIGI